MNVQCLTLYLEDRGTGNSYLFLFSFTPFLLSLVSKVSRRCSDLFIASCIYCHIAFQSFLHQYVVTSGMYLFPHRFTSIGEFHFFKIDFYFSWCTIQVFDIYNPHNVITMLSNHLSLCKHHSIIGSIPVHLFTHHLTILHSGNHLFGLCSYESSVFALF